MSVSANRWVNIRKYRATYKKANLKIFVKFSERRLQYSPLVKWQVKTFTTYIFPVNFVKYLKEAILSYTCQLLFSTPKAYSERSQKPKIELFCRNS